MLSVAAIKAFSKGKLLSIPWGRAKKGYCFYIRNPPSSGLGRFGPLDLLLVNGIGRRNAVIGILLFDERMTTLKS
mgnify:CR=1 FL=1